MKKEKIFTEEELAEMMQKATCRFLDKTFMFEQLFGTPTFEQRKSKLVLKIVKLIDKASKEIDAERKQISEDIKSNQQIN